MTNAPQSKGTAGRKPQPKLPPGADQVLDFASRYPDVFKVIGERIAEDVRLQREERKSAEYVRILKERFESFATPGRFAPGDLVVWKAGLKNRSRPDYEERMVVVEILDPPMYSNEDGVGSAYFRERLDLIGGVLDSEQELVLYHFDSRRFRPLEPVA